MADEVKLTLRASPELHERLKERAEREHRSVHGQMLVYIERGLAADEGNEQQGEAG